LPGLAVLALILVPFIDRGVMMKVTRRTVAIAVVLLAAIGWGGLTLAAVKSTPKETQAVLIDYSAPTDWLQLSPEEMAGIGYFRRENCISCHVVSDHGNAIGPDLTQTAIKKDAAWMIAHFKRPSAIVPGSSMPPIQLSDAQLNALASFLLKLNDRNATALASAPDFAVEGALIYQANRCGACHMVNGVGMKIGPPLNGLSKRQSRSWVLEHFQDPQKLSPGSIMPPYNLPHRDLENLTSYLFALPE
jgi:ubiquinol-cytochrome c reductase cytochrome b subunit